MSELKKFNSFNANGVSGRDRSRITLDVYAQAVTPAKRKAQGKVVAMLRDTEKKSS